MASGAIRRLLEGLPGTLEALMEHPARHRPQVVAGLLDRVEEIRRQGGEEAREVAEAGRRLAAEIPSFYPRAQRFRLRARSLEVWGSLQRDLGDPLAAEGGYMVAFELLSQAGAGAADLAGLLGRQALVAGDREDDMELATYVKSAVLMAEEAGPQGPFEVLVPLCEAVMSERGSVLPAMWVAMALVNYTNMVAADGTILRPNLRLHPEPLEGGGLEIQIRREIPIGVVPWKLSASIRLYSQKDCDVHLAREVPAAAPGGAPGWEVRAG